MINIGTFDFATTTADWTIGTGPLALVVIVIVIVIVVMNALDGNDDER